jgi:hypothetical protein
MYESIPPTPKELFKENFVFDRNMGQIFQFLMFIKIKTLRADILKIKIDEIV